MSMSRRDKQRRQAGVFHIEAMQALEATGEKIKEALGVGREDEDDFANRRREYRRSLPSLPPARRDPHRDDKEEEYGDEGDPFAAFDRHSRNPPPPSHNNYNDNNDYDDRDNDRGHNTSGHTYEEGRSHLQRSHHGGYGRDERERRVRKSAGWHPLMVDDENEEKEDWENERESRHGYPNNSMPHSVHMSDHRSGDSLNHGDHGRAATYTPDSAPPDYSPPSREEEGSRPYNTLHSSWRNFGKARDKLTSVGKTGFNASLNAMSSMGSKVTSLTSSQQRPVKEERPVNIPERKITKEERSSHEYESMLNEALTQDFSDLLPLKLVYEAGTDNWGRPVIVFVPANWTLANTDKRLIDLRRMLLFMISVMDKVVENEYTLVFCATGMSSSQSPPLAFLKKAYSIFNRKYKKNLKALYIIHPALWIKATLKLVKPFISNKFWKKLVYIENTTDIYSYIKPDQLTLPEFVLTYKRKEGRAEPVFGVPLDDAVKRSLTHSGLPLVCERAFEVLEVQGLKTEGIFRISGSNALIQEVKKEFDRGNDVDLFELNNPHVVAGVLKQYLRDLPEPLFTNNLYINWIQAITKHNAYCEEMKEELIQLIGALPENNRMLCTRLFLLLGRIASCSDINKMSAANLAIVFGPNLMRAPPEFKDRMLTDTGIINHLLLILIEHCDELFKA